MYTMIPQILLNFTKISATKQIATPMLEFLSTLIRLPDTFSKFFPTDFMSVFAIALNFTNPFRLEMSTQREASPSSFAIKFCFLVQNKPGYHPEKLCCMM
jgi:hypothetical protein